MTITLPILPLPRPHTRIHMILPSHNQLTPLRSADIPARSADPLKSADQNIPTRSTLLPIFVHTIASTLLIPLNSLYPSLSAYALHMTFIPLNSLVRVFISILFPPPSPILPCSVNLIIADFMLYDCSPIPPAMCISTAVSWLFSYSFLVYHSKSMLLIKSSSACLGC